MVYMESIFLQGAIQNELPEEYINNLKKIECNDYSGTCEVYDDIQKLIKEGV